jgi:hypothetical protein
VAGPFESLLDRGPAHLLGQHGNEIVYGFLASADGTEAFRHKQLFALRGILGLPVHSVELSDDYIGCGLREPLCRQLDRRERHPFELVASLGAALFRICRPLHDRDLYHGAIGNGRIYISNEGLLFFRDCGVIPAALLHTGGNLRLNIAGMERVFGPHATVPPELLRGEPLSVKTDVFLIASVLYRLLRGHDPHEATSTLGRYKRIASGDFTPLHTDDELARWMTQSLSPSPTKRPSASESLASLQSLDKNTPFDSLFQERLMPLSETLPSFHCDAYSEPFLATEDDYSTQVHEWTSQLAAGKEQSRKAPPKQSWNSWLAILFLAAVTWVFIELGTAEMRSGSYDGRPGPTLQTQGSPVPRAIGKADKRRRADKGLRLPRRTIEP